MMHKGTVVIGVGSVMLVVFFVLARIGTYSTPLFAFYIVSIMLGAGLILLGKRMRDGHG
jgi:hypothetical protein